MATFNATTYSATSAAYNALAPVYIDGSSAAVSVSSTSATGLAAYGGAFGNVMAAFAVDGGDSILGGNVIVAGVLNTAGNLVAITSFVTTTARNTYTLYYPVPASSTAFQTLIATKVPWGRYSAASWVSGTNTLTDLTGNGRSATTSGVASGSASGNGATASIAYLSGTPTSTIAWPLGSVPAVYTIAFLTRYATTGSKGRVLIAGGNFFGHLGANRGVYYDGGFKTAQANTGTQTDWLNMVVTNNAAIAVPANVLINGTSSATSNGGDGAVRSITLNSGTAETSDFQFSQLIVWNQVLTAAEMVTVSNALTTYLSTGVLQ